MNIYLPFKPIKGQAFRLYYGTIYNSNVFADESTGIRYMHISKDGNSFSSLVNTRVLVSAGPVGAYAHSYNYIDLTSEEMNANVIVICQANNAIHTNGYAKRFIIYTQEQELTSTPSKISSLEDKITALFQYFFGKRTVTGAKETIYKDDGATVLGEGDISDDGTVVTKGKIV